MPRKLILPRDDFILVFLLAHAMILILQLFDKTIKLQVKGDPRGLSNKPEHQHPNVGGGEGSRGKTKSMDQSQVALRLYHLGLYNHIKVSYRDLMFACGVSYLWYIHNRHHSGSKEASTVHVSKSLSSGDSILICNSTHSQRLLLITRARSPRTVPHVPTQGSLAS